MTTLNAQLANLKVIPVIAINRAEDAIPLGKALVENGMPCAEITLRTECAIEAISIMRKTYPDMLIGAGTVLTTEQVDASINAGVDFIVSPGFNPRTVQHCIDKGVAIVPGVNNPSLVEQAMEMGLRTLKFFPAEPSGGTAMLKALTAVYPVKFMPTGGVSLKNVDAYLSIPSVLACGGTWMVPTNLIDEGKWDELGKLVRDAVDHVND
ncbi:bifunctional 4-hydroxy-2-oxoglutarate aldolase/2-dehydro-3-deoxy-phosphogluconate aldolase [Vibrio sp. IB15]|jgi:2-dehydro-3-deoxyphosphogluconate aldolase/(4S)-4-hydroxy-2-oxoglutarate aldolase|uniref:2-dehydro-3-deoxy-phosphogluconate aldolase n=1 Tax=Vibrio chagasii TaxID=170679 RepID=A0A7V7NT11_9VIBR|nr:MULTISPECIES: bifunctional 4-hydroxy-2-oxoglutarate aldolase/2-dehydro-3-deoxy-phosphogluconate aldolase [Vibrio]KAB0479105.1 bifunctional 4-hydroxy-2-oxoglutarate aldolase/2-dehydro-3-deoxy-phosphogluconate aldolase [Vibrio chagasii]MBJ2145683.1 bifunctional 4-hydroxy-2-oxoglutarate aldolase/2-dehydro-3-deoxy-phosphogluconate aldolase [Vibrio sp. IB15]NOH32503.1 bifunctional 4-hydroxy-2-oxoglutarate aldolase/2-dehydro-3-deoxy-phosphogluconate aldolase [Vibrio chagasii]PML41423.1 ketohydroxy